MERPVWYKMSAPVEKRPIAYGGGERKMRADWFSWLAYAALGVFLAAQFCFMAWLDFV